MINTNKSWVYSRDNFDGLHTCSWKVVYSLSIHTTSFLKGDLDIMIRTLNASMQNPIKASTGPLSTFQICRQAMVSCLTEWCLVFKPLYLHFRFAGRLWYLSLSQWCLAFEPLYLHLRFAGRLWHIFFPSGVPYLNYYMYQFRNTGMRCYLSFLNGVLYLNYMYYMNIFISELQACYSVSP